MKDCKTIFLADDDVDDLHFMDEISTSLGHKTRLFSDGNDMLSALNSKETKPDLIFLDISMPVTDGFEVLDRLRFTKEEFREIPIVIHSGRSDEKSIKKCYELGANYFIIKAFNYNSMKSAMEYAITQDWKTCRASLYDFIHDHTS